MLNGTEKKRIPHSPLYLLFILAVSTFIVETLLMVIFSFLPPLTVWVQALLDGAFLVILFFPCLYFFSFRPMMQYLARREETEMILQQTNADLENRVQERTATLLQTNQELQVEIAERKRAESEIQSQARFPEEDPNPIIRVTWSGEVMYANKPGRMLLSEWQGVRDTQLSSHWQEWVEWLAAVYASGSDQSSDWQIGEKFYDFKLAPFHKEGYLNLYAVDVTKRKQAEEALRESEQRYRQIVDTASEGMVISDENYVIAFANPRAAEMWGYTHEELIGKPFRDFLFSEDIADHEQKTIDRKQGIAGRYERRFRRKDGNGIWTILSATPLFDESSHFKGALMMLTDITERKQAEEQVKRRVVELELIYENGLALSRLLEPHEIGQKIIDLLARKLNWHHTAVRLLNPAKNSVELVVFHHADTVTEEQQHETTKLNHLISRSGEGLSGWVIQHGESVLCEDVWQDARYVGSYANTQSGVYVPIIPGSETGAIGCISVETTQRSSFDEHDLRLLNTIASQAAIAMENARLYQSGQNELAERKRVEEELRVLNDQLERRVAERTEALRLANAALERASRSKDEFLASMSHELRTPLTGVLNLCESLQEQVFGKLNEKQLQMLHVIDASGRHLLGLINDILDLSKVEAGQLELHMIMCSVNDICQASLQMMKGMNQKKHQTVSFTIQPSNIEMQSDPRRLKQMLVNLLSNAVKFTPEGGHISLDVKGDKTQHEVLFTVSDNGIGIDAKDMSRLFHPFTQLDSSLSRQQSGTGLGLALVKRMVDLHNGSIRVQSTPGEGSQFTISLPWYEPVETEPKGELNRLEENKTLEQDILSDYNELTQRLSEDGFSYTLYERHQGAFEVITEAMPRLILLDTQLPDGSAWELLRHVKADERTAQIPIIVVSTRDDRSQAETCGASGCLQKPIRYSDVQSLLEYLPSDPSQFSKQVMAIGAVCSGPLILLAEDHEINLQTYSDYLRVKGFRVLLARDGEEAIQVAHANNPDLILMDIQMPRMDGLTAIKQIRASSDEALAGKPIIALTALAMAEDRQRCLVAGADDYMHKPVSLHEMVEVILLHLRHADAL